ncbi:MED6 [Bugula neritina]|uniref:Mediator of RNA polymerase II transcription subunit 6 n=1 Tax=Bugula neritina TaxID=10212 RepID=A0A7J7KDP1_BUGNE|nr:MED6 [Bugula neritina]
MADEELGISWHDSSWIPLLNTGNILDYFGRSKFYDRTCNNEVIKMQRQSIEQLVNLTGIEYKLVHVQPPILYIIRKQYRQNSESVTPMAHYYVIGGIIYKAPDVCTLVNSRMMNTTFSLNEALNKAIKHARYHPSKGYWWHFTEQKGQEEDVEPPKEQASWFQRQRVDLLLGELARQYPMKVSQPAVTLKTETSQSVSLVKSEDIKDVKVSLKRELTDPSSTTQPSAKVSRIKTEAGS